MSTPAPSTSVPSIFQFESKQFRIIVNDGEPWFIAADVCKILELGNPTNAVAALDDDEKALSSIKGLSRGNDQANIINESGLYTLILRCRDAVKPGSIPHRFRKKVTSEILPTIRKTGRYEVQAVSPSILDGQLVVDHFDDGTQKIHIKGFYLHKPERATCAAVELAEFARELWERSDTDILPQTTLRKPQNALAKRAAA